MADIDAAIAERATQQLGLITRTQCHDLGMSRHMADTRVRRGVLQRASPHVLRVAGSARTWRQDVLAACLEAGDGSAASHRSAARLWRLAGAPRGAIDISVPRHRRPRYLPSVVHQPMRLDTVDVTTIGPIPVTTIARTLIDCAAVLPYPVLETMVDTALRDGLVREPYLRWRIDELRGRGRPGIAAIEAVLRPPPTANGRRPESWLERKVLAVYRAGGLPAPSVQVHVKKRGGGVARVDCHFGTRLIVEVDGHRTHSTRRQRMADAERRTRLRMAGLEVLEFTYEDVVERPAYVCEMTRAHLAA
jgi:hypothetical protein